MARRVAKNAKSYTDKPIFMKKLLPVFVILLTFILTSNAQEKAWKGTSIDFKHGKLQISENKRFLVFEDGSPFFYLGDTGWEMLPIEQG